MQKETLAVATALRGSGILISALSGGWLSVAVGSCTLAMPGQSRETGTAFPTGPCFN